MEQNPETCRTSKRTYIRTKQFTASCLAWNL